MSSQSVRPRCNVASTFPGFNSLIISSARTCHAGAYRRGAVPSRDVTSGDKCARNAPNPLIVYLSALKRNTLGTQDQASSPGGSH